MNGHNSPGSTWTEESKKRSKNNAIGGRSVNIGVDSLTAAPVGNEGQRLNDWMQRRIAQTKNDGVNFTQRKGGDVPKQRMRCEETEVRAELRTRGQAFKVRSPRQARPGQARIGSTTTNKVQTPGVKISAAHTKPAISTPSEVINSHSPPLDHWCTADSSS